MSDTNGYALIRDAIYDACKTTLPAMLPGIRVSQTPPAKVNVPAAIIRPAAQTVKYGDKTLSELSAPFRFELWILLGNINEHAAELKAGEIVAPGSELIHALSYADIPNGWLDPVDSNVGPQTYEGRTYGGAKINIAGVA